MKKSFMGKSAIVLLSSLLLLMQPLSPALAGAEITPGGLPKAALSDLHEQLRAALHSAEAEALSTAEIISPEINTASKDSIRVIVQLSEEPVSVKEFVAKQSGKALSTQSAQQKVLTQQASVLKSSSAMGIGLKVNYRYDTVLNGMEVTVRADQVPALAKIPGVKRIHESYTYYPIPGIESSGVSAENGPAFDIAPLAQIGADKAWEMGVTGQGVKVGVLDTGADFVHPDLAPAYRGGWNSITQDGNSYEEPPLAPWEDPFGTGFEGTYHGTHVSGTILGRGVNPTAEAVQKGVAYEAELHSYKVLGRNLETGESSGTSAQIIDGLEHAVKDGMDVINMSLGSDGDKDPDSPDAIAVNNAVLAGVVVVLASGNAGDSGPYYYSMGSPAGAQLAISVAAVNSPGSYFTTSVNYSLTDSAGTVTADTYGTVTGDTYRPLDLVGWNKGQENFEDLLDGTEEAVYVGLGTKRDFRSVDVQNKIALISRGEIALVEKVENAKAYGAKAVIIFNGIETEEYGTNVPNLAESIPGRDGVIGGVLYSGAKKDSIPLFDMAGSYGRAIARQLLASPGASLQFTFDGGFQKLNDAGDHIASFSSRGPNSDGNYSIKPDLAAPGVNIYSTWPAYGIYNPEANYDEAYNRISGTSMATPHVAGAAALLKQKYPDWTPADVRAALANTAEVLYDEKGTQYDVYSQGSGRINVAYALQTPALVKAMDEITIYDEQMNAITMDSEASNLSFGTLEPGAEHAVSKPLELESVTDVTYTYTAEIEMHAQVTSDPNDPIATPDVNDLQITLGGLTDQANGLITVAPNETHPFTLTAEANPDAADGVYEGEVVLRSENAPTLHLPFVIHVGEDTADNDFGVSEMTLSDSKLTPLVNTIDISAKLQASDINYILADVEGLGNEDVGGTIAEMYDVDMETKQFNLLPKGKFTLEQFDGSYYDSNELNSDDSGNYVPKLLEEGLYQLIVYAFHVNEDGSIDESNINYAFKSFAVTAGGGVIPTPTPTATPTPSATPTASPTPSATPTSGSGSDPGPGTVGGTAPSPSPSASSAVGVKTNLEVQTSVIEQGQQVFPVTPEMTVEGQTLHATLSNAELNKALEAAKSTSAAFVISSSSSDAAEAELNLTAAQVELLKEAPAGSILVFSWNDASVALPLSVLGTVPADAGLVLNIGKQPGGAAVFQKQYPDAKLLGTPYLFEAGITAGGSETPLAFIGTQAIKRAFLLDQGVNTATAGALYEEDGQVYPVPASFMSTPGGTVVSISRPGFSTYAVAERHVVFTDISTSWAKNQIQNLADRFILNGVTATTFEPKSNVSRAQFASMLVRALGLQKSQAAAPFSDVTAGSWFAADAAAAYAAGLIQGTDGKFNPNAPISRQDLTVMLARAIALLELQNPANSGGRAYADSAEFGAYALDSIRIVSNLGLMEGMERQGSFYFDPHGATTREAAAKVLEALLQAAGRIN